MPNTPHARLEAALRLQPDKPLRLDKLDPGDRLGLDSKAKGKVALRRNVEHIASLQERLYSEHRRALLVVLQALDAGGKDGTTRAVFSGVNPQGCRVTSFKAPSADELSHDFLWRIHASVPRHGEIGIFNRSHYEDVLVVRVDSLVPASVWKARYGQINAYERFLVETGTEVVKIFLHLSRDEQAVRLRERISDPEKRWKFSPDDLRKRGQWDAYQAAYEDALHRCTTKWSPWYVVPADRNWVRNVAVSAIVRARLERMNPQHPHPEWDSSVVVVD